jgi:DNA helicase-2/ATP-dependent DNA helicase PcrA
MAWKAEEEIFIAMNSYIIQGVIDLIEFDSEKVEIVDYKTGPKPDADTEADMIRNYKKQLEIYAYLVEKKYNLKVSRMHLYYTSTVDENPFISFEWSREAIEDTMNEFTDTVKNIENKKFDRNTENSHLCGFCDMKYVCGKVNCSK